MSRFVDVKRVLLDVSFLPGDLELDVLADTISSIAYQFGSRLTDERWQTLLRNLAMVCEVINDQQQSEEFNTAEKMNRCVEWLDADLRTALGAPRTKKRERRGRSERRDADRRGHPNVEQDGAERRLSDRRKMDSRRDDSERRGTSDIF